ncbi:hypothetical protein [Deinococcus sp. QL22]|uniref:hypothetical protein n=1 Tax=Deinococcus sp. QL22 TaxID=2939437 RepID=UPI0020180682|nr:hypothetical protein [Deinococcus sp. QL22]UQN08068.1 hypothetical protein M1R55_18430 [Deinococcus sp. QL22]
MHVTLSVILDAPAARVWREVQTSRLLEYVASPFQTFEPVQPYMLPQIWRTGTYLVRLRLGGLLPLGLQWIVISFPSSAVGFELRDQGRGHLARTWDHRITVQALPGGRTRYTDAVEVRAGLLTPLVWGFAQLFYRHRQRRWQRLVRSGFGYT